MHVAPKRIEASTDASRVSLRTKSWEQAQRIRHDHHTLSRSTLSISTLLCAANIHVNAMMQSSAPCMQLAFNHANGLFTLQRAPHGSRNTCAPMASMSTLSARTRSMAAAFAAATLLSCGAPSMVSAVVSSPLCIKGEGPGCDANAAENPLIGELLEKSRRNKEANDKATLEKYWKQGYGDYFSYGYNKELKQGEDGKWSLEEPEDAIASAVRRLQALAQTKEK